MAIKIVLSNLVKFRVRGEINDENGNKQAVDFSLTCERHPADEWPKIFVEGEKLSQGFAKITKDWGDVLDEKGQPVPYSAEALDQLFSIPGVAQLTYVAYATESGVKAKN
ncbi:hypothetical protein [Comamonas kerstersii]|uniref:hypothetical protein n=1 Tax=Comamonas kerstersii TaxID=225992 RepID=UPI001B32F6AC|nr:hypothetical protein [Comamonas kerstersii]QTW18185.1 hypothetical protein H8N02_13495 [Comamonas kerstersii]